MEYTDIDYTGWKNGRCLWISSKASGKGADRYNARTVAKMMREGYEVREMTRAEASAAHRAAMGHHSSSAGLNFTPVE